MTCDLRAPSDSPAGRGDYEPFRGIRTVRDLLLVDRATRTGETVQLEAAPCYPEICLWVTVRCSELELFHDDGQTLVAAAPGEGPGWRLRLTRHGYLEFEADDPDPTGRLRVQSHLPVHAAVRPEESCRLGVCLTSPGWRHRGSHPTGDRVRSSLRLFAGRGASGTLSEIGGEDYTLPPALNPVPETFVVGQEAGGDSAFAGRVERVTAYNTARLELFDTGPKYRPAPEALPLIPGGSSFEPRWVDHETIEVFTHPDFSGSDSAWVHLDLRRLPGACRRLRLWTTWHAATRMTPTFFWSRDGDAWERVVPARVSMRMGDGRNFQAEFEVAGLLREGGYLASTPVFKTEHREALLAWAGRQPGVTVTRIGTSGLGRPIHAIRLGRGKDGPGRRGVAITCGQHSPHEIMDGHLIRPLLERLLANPALLDGCGFHIVPTINVDAQHFGGGSGANAHGRNTNRHWFTELQPETRACIDHFDALKQAGQRIDFALDLHAGGTFRNHLLFYMGDGEAARIAPEAAAEQEEWRTLLETHAGIRRSESRPMKQQALRATDYFHQAHGAVAFILELSTCSSFDPAQGRTRPFGPQTFETLAEGLVRSFVAKLSPSPA